jgi:Carboxypeptidase regulatory-like domain
MGAFAFLIETHTEFQPSYDSALSEATLVWPGILSVLERPISITGRVTDAATGAPVAAKVDLLNVTFSNGESNGSGGPHGRYHIFLPAGTYDIRFSAAGYVPFTTQVSVTATSSMNLDVQLSGALTRPTGLRIVP